MAKTYLHLLLCRPSDPEDEPDFVDRNPAWEDSLDLSGMPDQPGNLQKESDESKLQKAFAAIANAGGGVMVTTNDSIATKRWKNAYLKLKKLLVIQSQDVIIPDDLLIKHKFNKLSVQDINCM